MAQIYKSKTDTRLVVDVVAPGFGAENVTVRKRIINDGKSTELVVAGKYVRPRGATDKVVPRFAYDKVVEDTFKVTVPVEGDLDVDGTMYEVKNGVIRITVPKTAAAIGEKLAPIAADGNVNAVNIRGLDADDADE